MGHRAGPGDYPATILDYVASSPVPSPAWNAGCPDANSRATDIMTQMGGPMWQTLHYASYQCPEPFAQYAPILLNLVHSYHAILPCADCKSHFAALLQQNPPERAAARGKDAFARWTVDAHNSVNARLGKPIVSYADALRLYGRTDLMCPERGSRSASSASGGCGDGKRRLVSATALYVVVGIIVVALLAVAVLGGAALFGLFAPTLAPQPADRASEAASTAAAAAADLVPAPSAAPCPN